MIIINFIECRTIAKLSKVINCQEAKGEMNLDRKIMKFKRSKIIGNMLRIYRSKDKLK